MVALELLVRTIGIAQRISGNGCDVVLRIVTGQITGDWSNSGVVAERKRKKETEMIEGVDYSSTSWSGSPNVEVLQASGKRFVGRYAVNDKSPGGRGITAEEYFRMASAKIDVFLYWQTTTSWMLGGFAAGVQGAQNAQSNIIAAGMPPQTPIYFAVDFDAADWQMPAIHDCLRGCASVIGLERVGVYGGWSVIDSCSKAGTAEWFCQTLAWMYGRGWHPAAHLHQYGFNAYIDGTNCDLVRATTENYGQASFQPPIDPVDPYAPIWLPEGWKEKSEDPNATVFSDGDYKFRPVRMNFNVKILTTRRSKPDSKSPVSGPKYDPGFKVFSQFVVVKRKVKGYYIQDQDGHYVLGSKCSPSVEIEPW